VNSWAGAAREWIVASGPVRACALAFTAGVLATLALAPFHVAPVYLISFTLLVWLLDRAADIRAAGATGWWFGFGFFLSGLYWVGFALVVDAEAFAHFIPAAVLLLPGGLALFTAAAAMLAKLGWRGPYVGRIVLLALSWSSFEWLRGHVFTGFPWNLAGYAWSSDFPLWLAIAQSAAITGIYGLSLLTVLLAALPALLAYGTPRNPWVGVPLACGGVMIVAMASFGAWRLSQPEPGEVAGVRLRIVQPNIPQAAKWLPEQRGAIFRKLMELSLTPSVDPPTHILWPEAATPFLLLQSSPALERMGSLVGPAGAVITGSPRLGEGEGLSPLDAPVYNSVLVVKGGGEVGDIYDKAHLVPFGEFLPFPELFAAIGFRKLTVDLGSFAAGRGPQTLTAPGLPPFSPLICYEAIFPAGAVNRKDRPAWLLNVTNDAWFGNTSGPAQHFAQARMRAIEQGLPLARVANTGISGVIDAYGRREKALGLNQQGVLDVSLPNIIAITPYARFGDSTYVFLLMFFGTVYLSTLMGRGKSHQF
jgi:apolipoprotein N-acyltransferase